MADDDNDEHEGPEDELDEDEIEPDDAYELAREIAEEALEAYANGDKETGDRLIEEAGAVDPDAVQDVYDELEEDAASEHDPEVLNRELDRD